MRILSLLFALLQIQFQFEQVPPGQPQNPASVDGVVIDSETKQPLPGATIMLQDRGGYGGKMIIVTGIDGRFVFRNVSPGPYTMEASRAGYVSEMIGNPLSAATLNVPIVQQLNPGQMLSDVRLSLTPAGVITGRLTDDHGEPVVGTIIQAFKTTHRDGLRERTSVQSVVSNDLGEYRFFMLKPGQYYIAVFPPTGALNFTIPLFYPGTIDANAAMPVDLHVGETIERLDFSSISTKNRRITGGVQGNGSDGVSVILSPANGIAKKSVTITRDDVNPSFQFNDVIPGTYTLVGVNVGARAAIPLDVRNTDILGMRLLMGPGFKIPVRARIEGHPPGDDPELEKLYFNVRPDVPVAGLDLQTYSPFADGRFTLDVLRQDYWIDIARNENYYVKSITLDGVDVLNKGLQVMNSVDGPMEIVVDNQFGDVQGSAASPNVTIVLVPDAARRNQRPLYKSTKSANGVFHFQKVPPGDYKLFAWSEGTIDNGGPWLDPQYLRKYEDRATPVRIQAGMKTLLDRPMPVF
jgi:Carboxypeptidase regulatory-like domain